MTKKTRKLVNQRYWLMTISFSLLISAGIYFISPDFFRDYLPNLLATVVGVIIGIPVAIWLSTYQEKETEEQKKQKILSLLRVELKANEQVLQNWEGANDKGLDTYTVLLDAELKIETWKAFSDGGELEWIKDSGVLFMLSQTYHYIRVIKRLSEQYLSLNIASSRSKKVKKAVSSHLEKTVSMAIKAIEVIMNVLDGEVRFGEYRNIVGQKDQFDFANSQSDSSRQANSDISQLNLFARIMNEQEKEE